MEILLAIASKAAEYLVKPAINQARYLFCFNNIVEDLKREEGDLKSAKGNVEKDVEIAERNTRKTKEDVSKWLTDAKDVLADVQLLKEEIDLNKTCFNGWCPNCCCRYWLGRKAAKKTSIMSELRGRGKFNSVARLATLPRTEFLAPKDFELFQSSEIAFGQIIEALKNDQISMVGLYGMGGAGKTTLAKAVSKKVEEEKIFDEVVMVVISKFPNFINIQDVLAESMGLKLEEKTEEGRAMRLYLRFIGTSTQTKKKILVILDDVWETFDLKSKIGFPFGEDNKDCKILVTTRKLHVCSAMGCERQIPLNLLDEDEGLALLNRHAGLDNESHELNDWALKVAKECKGLPLALVTIGRALKGKGDNEWKAVFQKLKKSKLTEICNVVDVDKDVYATLKVSYDYLEGDKVKFCFLLCSLFPEDYKIPLEKLVRYGMGLGLFPDAESVEDARTTLRGMVNKLRASFLLLDAGDEEHVKMHDMLRDVALWIASQGERVFMVKAGMRLTEWPSEESLGHYTAISFIDNYIKVLPNGLYCPMLEMLLVEGESREEKLSDQVFEEMKGLKVINLKRWRLSLKSLQFLTNLKTLELINCDLGDFSYLEKLKKLEILSFEGSDFDELPRELSEIPKLRKLDLVRCHKLTRIPSNVIERCSQLEELDISDSFTNWEVEETSAEGSNACLFELNSLSRLVGLQLRIDAKYIPKDFAFPKLLKYAIAMNSYYGKSYERALQISDIEVTSMIAFKSLYETLEYLHLEKTRGCQNIVPDIHEGGLKELKEMEILTCNMLQYVFQLEGLSHVGKENLMLVPSLAKLKLEKLQQLQSIWKGPTDRIDLKSLAHLHIDSCESLEHIFPISIASNLVHLEKLCIKKAPKLKQVFHMDHRREGIVAEDDGKDIFLPKLRGLTLERLDSLKSILPENYHLFCSVLEELKVSNCSNFTTFFSSEVKQDIKEKLRSLEIEDWHHELWDGLMLNCLRYPLKNLEILRIKDCGVEVVFQLEGLVATTIDGQRDELLFPNLKKVRLESLIRLEGLVKGPTNFLSLQNLTTLEVSKCHKLRYMFSSILVPKLFQLSELSIEDCGGLEQIIVVEDQSQPLSFPNLSRVTVTRCNKLKHLFPITIAQSLQKLEYIAVRESLHLEAIFGHKDGGDIMNDKEIVLPRPMELSLKALPSFTNFCPAGYHLTLEWETLCMEGFEEDHLHQVWVENFTYVRNVKELDIRDCGVKELKDLYMGPTHFLSFQNLTFLKIISCSEVRHIFTYTLAQSLLQLKTLYVWCCGELEEIIVEDDKEYNLQPLLFPNLSTVDVRKCNKLKRVFSIIIARGLQQLNYIYVEDNSQLEEVFGHRVRDGADVMDDKPIVFPQLQRLYLLTLPSLTNFCPMGYHFIFPSLGKDRGKLYVRGCGKVAIRFSLDEKGSVHAEGKPSKDDQHAPTMDINCYNYQDWQEQLPPYMEKLNEENKEIK